MYPDLHSGADNEPQTPTTRPAQGRITRVIRWSVFEFLWSDASEAHIARHNVTPMEVEEAVGKPNITTPGRNNSTLVYGRTYAGRYLLVVTREGPDGRTTVDTARDMDAKERKAFDQRKGQ
ncbi:hypothetical protein [Nocardia sp. MH4]|uniref:hypothetical protein n=1 Tax=Nocardia sp. MH4 TaxID=1768677 RepID=UPI001C4F456E|nr:hypothetical protein [Nocardia sp. MH4]